MKVLFLTPYVPYEGIDHAGGYFLYEYLKRLSLLVDITVLAPRTVENELAIMKENSYFKVRLTGAKVKEMKLLPKIYNLVKSFIYPLCPFGWLDVLRKELINESTLLNVDIVELQWAQMLPMISTIRSINDSVPIICFEHDVYTQSVLRQAKLTSFSKNKVIQVLQSFRVKSQEVKWLNKCNAIFLFSKKDKMVLRKMGVTVPIHPVAPLVEFDRGPGVDYSSVGEKCIFVGMMKRIENYESMEWFLREVWPIVMEKLPNASMIIIGSNPPESLLRYDCINNVEITGYVDDLSIYYKQADLFVAPLLTGAGVKFKIIQALAYGLPVVTTSIGAEGIIDVAPDGVLPCVEDEKHRFASCIIDLLNNQEKRKYAGELSRSWANEFYDFDKYTISTVLQVYRNFIQ